MLTAQVIPVNAGAVGLGQVGDVDAQRFPLQNTQAADHIEIGGIQAGKVLEYLLIRGFQVEGDQLGGDLIAHLLQLLADAGIGQGVGHDLRFGHIGALAGDTEQKPLLHQLGDDIAHRGAAYSIDMAQLVFRGDQFAGRPLLGLQFLED